MSNVVMTEYRFKRNLATKRAGWVEGRSKATDVWYPLIYVYSIKSANRWVIKDMKNREKPDVYTNLPLIEAHN